MRQRHRDVNELVATGLSLSAIGRRLQLDRKTVRRYRHNNLEDLLASAGDRGAGVLDPFTDYVQDRFQHQEGRGDPHPGSDAQPSHHHLMDHAPAGDTPRLG
ncbi:hypothetical protein [Streptomyces scabichelini]|uniref:hypothetical protein n=1 Tax=Streptomyces scabichelini TaxID=2711217 RepID=UPI001F499A68|nr:hypothetical protein [Streptomyces scabichelini]